MYLKYEYKGLATWYYHVASYYIIYSDPLWYAVYKRVLDSTQMCRYAIRNETWLALSFRFNSIAISVLFVFMYACYILGQYICLNQTATILFCWHEDFKQYT